MPKHGKSHGTGKHPDMQEGRSQCAPSGGEPGGFSEREEPRSFEARVCHQGAAPPGGVSEHLWQGRTRTPDTTPAVRPRCPRHTGGELVLGIPCVQRQGGWSSGGASARRTLRERVVRAALGQRHDMQRPQPLKEHTCTP